MGKPAGFTGANASCETHEGRVEFWSGPRGSVVRFVMTDEDREALSKGADVWVHFGHHPCGHGIMQISTEPLIAGELQS